MIYVTKVDGRRQPFDRQKIMRTCLRMGATPDIAKKIADKIEQQAYNGIPTKKIIKLIFSYIRRYKPEFKHMIDLRDAICLLRPKPDFELFVAQLLKAQGFKVRSNRIVPGKCVEHEIDAIAERPIGSSLTSTAQQKEVFYVEVKHHYKPHTYTGLDVFLEARATFEDLIDGYKVNKHKIPFTGAIVICNTKLSEHAKRYAKCRGVKGIAWNTPTDHGLERMIEEQRLYPITLLRGLEPAEQAKLGDAGIVILKQIAELSEEELNRQTKIPKKRVRELREKSIEILER